MEKIDIASQAEKYKQEMMKLYGKSSSTPPETAPKAVPAVNVRPETEELPEVENEQGNNIVTEPEEDLSVQIEDSIDERYPEPDLSELESDYGESMDAQDASEPAPYIDDENSMGTGRGYILVNVRAGDNAEPIKNATVHITAISNGNRLLIGTGSTDESGTTKRFEVSLPDASYSQTPDSSVRPYNLFDISVTANGFFNARSVDVPVFDGVTSVQTFNMVPVPLFMKSGEETVTIYNREPNL